MGYDHKGDTLTSTTGSNTTTYAWNYENRLTSITLPGSGGTASFKYDPFGRTIYKSSNCFKNCDQVFVQERPDKEKFWPTVLDSGINLHRIFGSNPVDNAPGCDAASQRHRPSRSLGVDFPVGQKVNQMPGKRLIYVAPFLHLCACLIIAMLRLEPAWHCMTIVDVPASIVVIAMLYDFDHPLILFGVIGTLWWFMLSLAVAYCWNFVRNIRSGS